MGRKQTYTTASKPVETEVCSLSFIPSPLGFLSFLDPPLLTCSLRTALHFKLSIANDAPTNHTSYEDTEFTYTPRLDNNRDRDLLDILPSYLVDEITFSRAHAGKFYGRVMDVLTVVRRTEEEVEEEEGEGE